MRSSWVRELAVGAAAVVAAVGVAVLPAPVAGAQEAPSGADLVQACDPLTAAPEVGPRACKSVEAGTWLAAQTCRRVPGADEALCPSLDGREVHEAAMTEFESGWLARALALQGELDRDVPLVHALLPHTHNSANATPYDPSLSTMDANQVITVTDQLRLGIRAIELDVHWAPHPAGDPAQGFREPVQCHGQAADTGTPLGAVHAGCSIDQPLGDRLAELRAWLDDNPDQLVLLYLENALDGDDAAHARAVELLEEHLGELVFRPTPGAGCQHLPVRTESKGSILASGSRVLLTGNCGPSGWTDLVFERGPAWSESGSTTGYECTADRARTSYADTLVRRYEDSTWLSKMAGGGSHISAEVLADMVRCGVNLPGFDQVHARDDRLASLVWSWRVDEPAVDAGACAAQGADARFFAADCATSLRVACRTGDAWAVTAEAVPWAEGDAACRADGHEGAGVPVDGWDNHRLREVAGDADVWLAYGQDEAGGWTRGIPAPDPGPEPDPEPDPRNPGRGHGAKPAQPGPPPGAGAPAGLAATAASTSPSTAPLAAVIVLLVAAGLVVGSRRRPPRPLRIRTRRDR